MLGRQIAIGFGIAIIFPLLAYYGVATFYPQPKRGTVAAVIMPPNPTPEERQRYQEQLRQRQQALREQQEQYNAGAKNFARHLVVISTPLGVAAILIGAYLTLHAIGTGLIFGGIFAVAWGYWGYWQFLDDWIRFVSLLAGFIILVFVGYRRVSPRAARAASS
jgi:uncharacterized membrane protein YphA (DoxX/SURF4 family)